MNKKVLNLNRKNRLLPLILILIFVYFLLFEFIIPPNNFLPKPSSLIESIPVLFDEYNFFSSFAFTFSAIYVLMFLSYFFIRIGFKWLFSAYDHLPYLRNAFGFGQYFLPFFLILLFNQWIPGIWGEYLFILILLMASLKKDVADQFSDLPEEYINSAKSLGLNNNEIINKVIFKAFQPGIISVFIKVHAFVWGWTIVYEFVNLNIGMGAVISEAVQYNDLSILILVILIVVIVLLIMEYFINQIKKRNFFWK